MADEEQLKRMVMTFRVSELQMLLGYAGKNKTGRKSELQGRALDIVKMRSTTINQKIRDLYKSIQQEMMSFGDRSQAAANGMPANIMPNPRVPTGLNPITSGYTQTGSLGVSHGTTVYGSNNQVNQTLSSTGYTLQSSHNSSYPISPDVRLKKLPFFDILAELLKPCTLAPQGSGRYQEATFSFSLTPQQANKIAHSRDLRPGKQDYTVQVQMRYCLLETTCEQEDNFPPNITVKINDKMCPLPSPIPTNKAGVEPKRPSRPVNITGLCKISPTVTNRILVSWSSEYGRCYVISVYLVQKLTSEDLLQRLKAKGSRLADFTKSLIKQKLLEDGECEIATTSLRCSLLCPLGKMRMMLPCRAETCIHLQCFDASLFLQMNERKPTWMCPVCDKSAIYDNLVIDGYFQEVLHENSTCTEVTLNKNGSWTPLVAKKEQKEPQAEKKKSEVAVETLSDDSEDDNDPIRNDYVVEEVKKRKAADVEIITLEDSDDDEPPAKRPAYQSSSADTESSSSKHTSSDSTKERSTTDSDCTTPGDSWHVGEVDPGKRLVFRKSIPCSNGNAGLSTSNNRGSNSATPPRPSHSTSPQIICLDSPTSSLSPPLRPRSETGESQVVTATIPTSHNITSVPTTAPPPYTSNSVYLSSSIPPAATASLTPLVGELHPVTSGSTSVPLGSPSGTPVTITPVPSSSLSPCEPIIDAAPSPSFMLTDPLATPTYMTSTGLSNTYNLAPGLQQLFNPLSMIPPTAPPTTNTEFNNFRQDRYI